MSSDNSLMSSDNQWGQNLVCRLLASRYGQWTAGQVGLQRQLCNPYPHLQLHTDAGPGQPLRHPGWCHAQSGPASPGKKRPGGKKDYTFQH